MGGEAWLRLSWIGGITGLWTMGVVGLLLFGGGVCAVASRPGSEVGGSRWRFDLQKIFGGHSGCWSLKMMMNERDS